MELTTQKVIEINKRFGGKPLNISNLDFDLDMTNQTNSKYRRCAYIIRGIVLGHSFNDGNKRTALYVISHELSCLKCNRIRMALGITNIAREQLTDINLIESRIRQWCTKN